jgi:hypothetical protein
MHELLLKDSPISRVEFEEEDGEDIELQTIPHIINQDNSTLSYTL